MFIIDFFKYKRLLIKKKKKTKKIFSETSQLLFKGKYDLGGNTTKPAP